ncbi:hypothetical protein M5C72_01860 [Companilactobacillus allii]|uniref:Lipoprotein n=1 Tax=Companilactobacillus allii TaxID=1847728 RepID=A0A1P8Q216_9LACO|nr:hypothetical protein [Companilactobacillus allii]APX71910.1 hypothetical protein BTM29_04775 [Companilactobacillus allii]USQ69003.1 hypothetical protein M5C72_01860 [Companilactobacillus allii]
MKKALALLATTAVGILLVGCSNGSSSASSDNNNNDYKTEMSKGNKAVNKKDYDSASDHFKSANEAKNTKKSKAYESQAKNLVKAKKSMNKLEFSSAKSALNTVKNQSNGNESMTKRAKNLLGQVKTIQRNRSDYKANIKTAKQLIADNNNDQARALLEQLTSTKGIKGKYYSDIYKQAKKLLDKLPASSVTADNTTDSNNNDSSSSTSSDSSTTSSDTTSSSNDDSDNPAANGDFDVESKEVDGKTITDSDIAKARQDLTDQGVKNVDAWSDNDILRAIKNANKDGRSTITAADGKIQ